MPCLNATRYLERSTKYRRSQGADGLVALGAETTALASFVPACARVSGTPAEGVAAAIEREILSQPDPLDFAQNAVCGRSGERVVSESEWVTGCGNH
ncbi:hypothetical protein ACIBCL_16740 [Micromonospora zamorensis]|uniref:hypothetical protein n=1 Tax=Micromonospora zamorensis TaxID=709883 RepID=UPI0037B12F0C